MARTQQEWEAIVGGGYTGTLGRTPDQSEINYWVNTAMNSGLGDQELINAFNNAAQAELAGRGNTVQDATNAFAQNSTAGQQNQASNVVNTGATGALSAANTAADVGDINLGGGTDSAAGALANASLPAAQQQQSEPTRSKADLEAIVRGAYETGLGRTPAQSEVDYWVGLEDQGLSDEEISAAFQNAAQTELKDRKSVV